MKKQLYTVFIFARLATKRFFRDRLALFFGIMFPVIFLFVFGAFSSNSSSNINFSVAFINQSKSQLASQAANIIEKSSVFKIDKTIKTIPQANTKLNDGQIDALIVFPKSFGQAVDHQMQGRAQVLYTYNNIQAGQTLTSLLTTEFNAVNKHYVAYRGPLSVKGQATKTKSLTSFDYTFSGLLGFAIAGTAIFGPVNVFPELKKQGILRRLHTTPLKVWQYFTATMIAQAITGLVALAVMFVVAIVVFNLKVDGNYLSIAIFLAYSVIAILGIGLAIGGWAKNERQAAPLSNIIIFPLLFLSGTFFPTYLMPHWLQDISTFLPLTPVITGARLLSTQGYSLVQVLPEIGILAAWIIIVYSLAFRLFRWE